MTFAEKFGNSCASIQAVEIEINRLCNLSCKYCPNHFFSLLDEQYISLDLYNRIIDQLVEISFTGRLSFDFYNEPLLYPYLLTIINLAVTKLPQVKIVIYTNGTLLTSELLQKLYQSKVYKIIVTKHIQVKKIPLDDYFNSLSKQEKSLIEYRHYSDMKLYNRGGVLNNIGEPIPNLLPCYIPSFLLCITSNGDVLGCFEDYHRKTVMGNILKEDLSSIWDNDIFQEFRKNCRLGLRHKNFICQHCNRTEVLLPE